MNYAVIVEPGETRDGASVPDLPGGVAVGEHLDEVTQRIREAIAFHLEGLREEGVPIPPATSLCEYVELQEGAA